MKITVRWLIKTTERYYVKATALLRFYIFIVLGNVTSKTQLKHETKISYWTLRITHMEVIVVCPKINFDIEPFLYNPKFRSTFAKKKAYLENKATFL